MRGILFDLDGTLLPVDTEKFLENYLRLLSQRVSAHVDPNKFITQLLASTKAMILSNDGIKTNEEVFMEDFFAKIPSNKDQLLPIFDEFYLNYFKQLKKHTEPKAFSKEIIETLSDKGYQLILATNPVFPRVAIEERLSWLDIEPKHFKLITSYENMHYCKPNINYYKEILNKCELQPNQCLMIGNDVEEDMVAKELGMEVYLVTDYLIQRNHQPERNVDWEGSLVQLVQHLKEKFA